MRRRTTAGTALVLLLFAAGCGPYEQHHEQETPAASQAERPDVVAKAVAIAKEIEASPDAAEEVLARHGLTVEQFEDMIFEISSDPELSKAYNSALE